MIIVHTKIYRESHYLCLISRYKVVTRNMGLCPSVDSPKATVKEKKVALEPFLLDSLVLFIDKLYQNEKKTEKLTKRNGRRVQ